MIIDNEKIFDWADQTEGILVQFHESKEFELVEESKKDKIKNFSDAFDILNWKIKDKEIAIISFSSKTFDYIALATKKHKVVTRKNKIEFSHIISLNKISKEEIQHQTNIDYESFFIDERNLNKEKLPLGILANLLSAFKEHNKYLEKDIDRLITLQKFSDYVFTGEKAEQLLQEREALASALDIFDSSTNLRKDILSSWIPNNKDIQITSEKEKKATFDSSSSEFLSFLDNIEEQTIQEETAIQHDLFNFANSIAQKVNGGVTTFSIGNRGLNILYANRNSLEKAIGVDLIYYNEKYNSFVLVQYKLLKEESRKFVYRPDKQMEEELLRMNIFMSNYKNHESIKTTEEYRLNDDGFLFKFVENKGIKITSSELISGLYITREYMNFIESDDAPKGKRGGTIISTKMTPRYLTNSEFTMLVNNGFLGTRELHSDILKELIKEYFSTGKAVLLAIETNKKIELLEDDYNY